MSKFKLGVKCKMDVLIFVIVGFQERYPRDKGDHIVDVSVRLSASYIQCIAGAEKSTDAGRKKR